MNFIVENKHFPEWVKSMDAIGFYLTENEDEAMRFDNADEAEDVRKRVQDSTGGIWRVYEITKDDKQAQPPKDLDTVYRGYLTLKQQDEEWNKVVYDYLHKVLDKQPDKCIEQPVDKGGSRFQLETEYLSNVVMAVYIDSEGDIVIESENDDMRYITKKDDVYRRLDCSIEDAFFLCECLEHYLNED